MQITMDCRQTRVSSFNCAGFKSNCGYINESVYKKCDILLLQETWLYKFEFLERNIEMLHVACFHVSRTALKNFV